MGRNTIFIMADLEGGKANSKKFRQTRITFQVGGRWPVLFFLTLILFFFFFLCVCVCVRGWSAWWVRRHMVGPGWVT